MGWVEALYGKVVGVDTSPFIYYIERYPGYVDIVRPFFQALNQGQIVAVTSMVTLLEVLVLPIRNNDMFLVGECTDIIQRTRCLLTFPVTEDIAREAARLRAVYNLRTPDSIQMATATVMGASFFLTNDARLPSLPALQVLMIDRLRTS